MKGIVLIIMVVVIGLFFFSSCSNKDKTYMYKRDLIVGDCINDSILLEIKMQLETSEWIDGNKYNNDTLEGLSFGKGIYLSKSLNDSIERYYFRHWSIKLKNNKLIAESYWGNGSSLDPVQYSTLLTVKQDTLFWNVVEILKQYCDVRDSSYLYNLEIRGNYQY